MSERASLSPHHRELMLSLAYLGGLTYALALRLLPCYSERTLQRDLADLRQLGDVEKHAVYKPGPKGRPVKQYDIWTLTDKGRTYIAGKASDQYPTKPAKLRHKRVMPHDLLVVKTIVALVERARHEALSGLFVQFETRLNPDERRPIPDAVVIMQFGGGFGRSDIVPWTKDPAIEDETRSRFAIEADFQTETLSVIAGKARAYKAAFENRKWRDWWAAQFGPQPIIMWVVADKDDDLQPAVDRLASIFRVSDSEWLNGYWVGTTEHLMEREAWAVHAAGKWGWYRLTTLQTERNIVTHHERPALPADRSQSAGGSGADRRPAHVVTRGYSTMPDANIVTRTPGAPSVARQAEPADATAIVSPGTTTSLGQRAARSAADDRSGDLVAPAYHYYPITPVPTRPVYIPPDTTLPEPPRGCAWLVMLVRDGYDEIRYALIRLLEVLGLIWLVRTFARLIAWFFLDEGYAVVGVLVVILVCLGVIGWTGHQFYSTYRENPLFSFGRQVLAPSAVAVISPVPATRRQSNDLLPPPVQPTRQPKCGVARVASEGLNLRETPGGQVLTVLVRGQEVVLLCGVERRGATEWVHVRGGEHVGWVSKQYLDLSNSGG